MSFFRNSLLFSFLAVNCLNASFYKGTTTYPLFSRGDESKETLYFLNLPYEWKQLPSLKDNRDTTTPLASFRCENIELSIYNFPKEAPPPEVQVQRWIKKLQASSEEVSITPFSCGGFSGLLLWAEHGNQAFFAAAIRCDLEIASAIKATTSDQNFSSQCLSSVTLKAAGPRDELFAKRYALEKSYRSFRLQKEVHKLL